MQDKISEIFNEWNDLKIRIHKTVLFASLTTVFYFNSPGSPIPPFWAMKTLMLFPIAAVFFLFSHFFVESVSLLNYGIKEKLWAGSVATISFLTGVGIIYGAYILLEDRRHMYGLPEIFSGAGAWTILFIWHRLKGHSLLPKREGPNLP